MGKVGILLPSPVTPSFTLSFLRITQYIGHNIVHVVVVIAVVVIIIVVIVIIVVRFALADVSDRIHLWLL